MLTPAPFHPPLTTRKGHARRPQAEPRSESHLRGDTRKDNEAKPSVRIYRRPSRASESHLRGDTRKDNEAKPSVRISRRPSRASESHLRGDTRKDNEPLGE